MCLQSKPGLDYLASTQAYFDDKQHFEEIRYISTLHRAFASCRCLPQRSLPPLNWRMAACTTSPPVQK